MLLLDLAIHFSRSGRGCCEKVPSWVIGQKNEPFFTKQPVLKKYTFSANNDY